MVDVRKGRLNITMYIGYMLYIYIYIYILGEVYFIRLLNYLEYWE